MNDILHKMLKLKNAMLMLVFLIAFSSSCNATSSESVLVENVSASMSSMRGNCDVVTKLIFNSIIIDILRTNSEDNEISSKDFKKINVSDIASLQEHLKSYSKMHVSVYHEISFSKENVIEVLRMFSNDKDSALAILKTFKIVIAESNAKSIADAVPKTIECLDLKCQFKSVKAAGDFLSAFQLLNEITLRNRWVDYKMLVGFLARTPNLNKIHFKSHSSSSDFFEFLRGIDNADDAVKAFYLNRLTELTLNSSRYIPSFDDFKSLTKLTSLNLMRFEIYDESLELKNFNTFENFENAIAQITSYKMNFENKLKIPSLKPQQPKMKQSPIERPNIRQYPILYQYRQSFIK